MPPPPPPALPGASHVMVVFAAWPGAGANCHPPGGYGRHATSPIPTRTHHALLRLGPAPPQASAFASILDVACCTCLPGWLALARCTRWQRTWRRTAAPRSWACGSGAASSRVMTTTARQAVGAAGGRGRAKRPGSGRRPGCALAALGRRGGGQRRWRLGQGASTCGYRGGVGNKGPASRRDAHQRLSLACRLLRRMGWQRSAHPASRCRPTPCRPLALGPPAFALSPALHPARPSSMAHSTRSSS